jgi:hypothetical protein
MGAVLQRLFMLRLLHEKESDMRRLESSDPNSPELVGQTISQEWNETVSLHSGEVLIDQKGVAFAVYLLHFSPIDVFGGAPRAQTGAFHLDSIVRVEENQGAFLQRLVRSLEILFPCYKTI